jgi:hypothetical protein
MGVADLTTQSPPLAITLGEIIRANDPKATATEGHAESVASFQFFGPARYGRWLDSRRYRWRQPPNTVHSYPFQPAFGVSSAV